MAPKKKQQQQKNKPSSSSSSKGHTTSSSGPKLQISAENENRLRRLLLNSGRSTPASFPAPADNSLSKEQKAKRLRSVYEKLSCEGFRDDQIELALSTLKESTTFEAALDWLCLNLTGNELPTKFSSGTSLYESGGSVGVISTARDDWVSSRDPSAIIVEDKRPEVAAKIKVRKDDETLDSFQRSQADWIRQYMEQQEEDEYDSWEANPIDNESLKKVLQPRTNPESIVDEYHSARLEALNAKERGDKKGQEQAGLIIRKLKQEISALGLSDDILASGYVSSSYRASKDTSSESTPSENFDSGTVTTNDIESSAASTEFVAEVTVEDSSGSHLCSTENVSSSVPKNDVADLEGKSGDVELGGFFIEDDTSGEVPLEVLELQKKEKLKELSSEMNLRKLEGIWKKGDPPKIPKAFLHQLCQRSGWEAPKYNKVLGRGHSSGYSVSVLQKASGRGKSRKAGGLMTIQLPDQDRTFNTAEDAQNKVATYALNCLFSDLPVHFALSEPYASLVLKWKEAELFTNVKDNQEDRRTGFVDSLLSSDRIESNVLPDVMDSPLEVKFQKPCIAEDITGGTNQNAERMNKDKHAESFYLKKEQERKKGTKKCKEMLESRSRLPIAELKGDILHLLEENNVLVICGETGCGKTTQVPQFILDNMIEAGCGGFCNIICTQPRRIAATSVAERVADERCEPSPGSNESLVGYQVRLDSARNERTKLLFCTTGILLRMISGEKDLAGVSHVIVDEVHERSLLGDFLLIVMKTLIEKQSTHRKSKLKVILMSATVDSHMFSKYFGNCPVITAQGRTHPVSTHYLEDIYELLEYRLDSDSPACINHGISVSEKSAPVGNRRGKKNLVLASWGDESILSEEYINPFYDPSNYQNYSKQTRQNLRKLNEDIIDYDLLEDLVCHIDETYAEGAILVFLPGVAEINILLDKLSASHRFGGLASEWLLPLHSSIASEDQKKVFQKPPDNIRKVIIATNIAETSITIDDVVYVIDCGKHKENRYNPQKKLSSMVEDWISQANARQRRGRAGRVKPGICFCLYTCHRYENLMHPYQMPEMMRMPLIELCLQVKLLSLGGIKQFLSKALEPPREEAIESAISSLYEVGAIEGDEELTPLGYHLAKLPVDVLIGKMMLYGGIFGCLSPILTISAFLSYKSPFIYPKDERENVERAKWALATDKIGGATVQIDGIRQSDHLVMMVAYQKWDKIMHEHGIRAAQKFCSLHFLSSSVMFMIRDMRIQLGTLLADIGIINIPKNYQVGWKKKEKLDTWLSDSSQTFNQCSSPFSAVKVNPSRKSVGIKIKSSRGLGSSSMSPCSNVELVKRGKTENNDSELLHQDSKSNDQELKAALEVIRKVMKTEAAEPFNVPVDPFALGIPDYFDVIDTPMDFGTICNNLEKGDKYMNVEDVFKDVQYIWENCYKYNNKGDYIVELMKRVKKNFIKCWAAAGLFGDQPQDTSGVKGTQMKDATPSSHENTPGDDGSLSLMGKKFHGLKKHKEGCLCAICVMMRRRQEREEVDRMMGGQTEGSDDSFGEEIRAEGVSHGGSPFDEYTSPNMENSPDAEADTGRKGQEIKFGDIKNLYSQQRENITIAGEGSLDENSIHYRMPHLGSGGNGKEMPLQKEGEGAAIDQQKPKEVLDRNQRTKMLENLRYLENPMLLELYGTLFSENNGSFWNGPHSLVKHRGSTRKSSIHEAIATFMK